VNTALARTGSRDSRLAARPTSDRGLLRAFLEEDRLFAAYAICDLDEQEFRHTRWGVAFDGERPVAAVLEHAGTLPQPVFAMGEPAGIEAVLRDVIRPRLAFMALRTEAIAAVERLYRLDPGGEMLRMWVDRASFRPHPGLTSRLLPAESGDLNRLYDMGFASWLPPSAVAEGVYHGVRIRGLLVAAAGTHVVSREARLAVVGNVLTHRDYRGRGLAKTTTSAVTQELLRTCDQVVLNVRADNVSAIAAYRALGYEEYARFEERLAHRRGSPWDGMMAPLRRLFTSRKEP
jgi:ribosomal protein S18 acetylase RimI-like enzyme